MRVLLLTQDVGESQTLGCTVLERLWYEVEKSIRRDGLLEVRGVVRRMRGEGSVSRR
jgi:hypothetical protein